LNPAEHARYNITSPSRFACSKKLYTHLIHYIHTCFIIASTFIRA
jgi:hypothetical protein